MFALGRAAPASVQQPPPAAEGADAEAPSPSSGPWLAQRLQQGTLLWAGSQGTASTHSRPSLGSQPALSLGLSSQGACSALCCARLPCTVCAVLACCAWLPLISQPLAPEAHAAPARRHGGRLGQLQARAGPVPAGTAAARGRRGQVRGVGNACTRSQPRAGGRLSLAGQRQQQREGQESARHQASLYRAAAGPRLALVGRVGGRTVPAEPGRVVRAAGAGTRRMRACSGRGGARQARHTAVIAVLHACAAYVLTHQHRP